MRALTQVVEFKDADGAVNSYRIPRPAVVRALRNAKPARVRAKLPDGGEVPPEVARTVLAENAEDHGEPITIMRAVSEFQQEIDSGKMSPRTRSIMRDRARKLREKK